MRVAILGSTGKLGALLVTRALDEGYEVQALARNPRKIHRAPDALTVFKGDAVTGEGLKEVLSRCSYVVSSLGSSSPVIAACVANVIRELQGARSLERFVFISWIGAGDSKLQAIKTSGPLPKLNRVLHRAMFEDITNAEELLRASTLPYVIVRPTQLTDGPITDQVVAVKATEEPPKRVSRADIARFVVGLLQEPGWDKREVTIGTKRR